jgi:excisionase family DNA binding protein
MRDDLGDPGLGFKNTERPRTVPRKESTKERDGGYWRLVLDDGSVLVPASVADGFQRMAQLGLSMLLRKNDGGAVSRGAIEVFHALQAAATRESERRSSASGSEFSDLGKVRRVGALTAGQAAERLGITPRAVRNACHGGRIRATRIGRDWAIETDALEDFRHGRRAA